MALSSPLDLHFLRHAQRVGTRGLGRTWPNPSVGCVLVKDGAVLAAARSADGGRPHAETEALRLAGMAAHSSTAYVTLEPCAHHGKTPPCAEALIAAGVARVVYACGDHDPRVAGKGIAMLREAGVEVTHIPLAEAERDHRGFFRRVRHGLPLVSMKLATSLDGRMSDPRGKSQWITGPAARAHGHGLRASADAIVTGIGTALADDPRLTARRPGLGHERLVRVVCDRRLRLPSQSQLARTADMQPLWIMTTAAAIERQASLATELRERGAVFHAIEGEELSPKAILEILGAQGITRVLVEAGPVLSTAFLAAECVDALHWYRAPMLLGNAGQAAVGPLESSLEKAGRGRLVDTCRLGPDIYEHYELDSCLPD